MNNSVFGKTCENIKKRTDIKLITNAEKARAMAQKPHCIGLRIFGENLVGINMRKQRALIDKPFYIGFTVLNLSKLLMYQFHYGYIKQKYGEKAELLFTDTDSLVYEIQTEDIYKDMQRDGPEYFDFSDYKPTSQFYDVSNKKVLGKFKDETNGKPVLEFVGLRPKMYSLQIIASADDGKIEEKHRAKGIQRVEARKLTHADYVDQLRNPHLTMVMNRRIGSKRHQVFTSESTRLGLSSADDKRFILPDRIHTLAYGHRGTVQNLSVRCEADSTIDPRIFLPRKTGAVPPSAPSSDSDCLEKSDWIEDGDEDYSDDEK